DQASAQSKPVLTPEPAEARTSGSAEVGVGEKATLEQAATPDVALPCASDSVQETPAHNDTAAQVVLDYCAAVRGILNDDQGGPLHPPGLRMAEALREAQESLQRNLQLNKPGPAHGQLERLAGCIESGLARVK